MAGNPLVAQGNLNRLKASVMIEAFAELNVTPSYLGKNMISVAFGGETTSYQGTATGAVPSPEPYQMVTVTMHLLKTQGLANLYKQQIESSSFLGDITVTPDTDTLDFYTFYNCSISNVSELSFAGQDAGYVVTLTGYYIINNDLWNQA